MDFQLSKKRKGREYRIGYSGGQYVVRLNVLTPMLQVRIGKLKKRYEQIGDDISTDDEAMEALEIMDEMWGLCIQDWERHRPWFEENVTDINDWRDLFIDILNKMAEQLTGEPSKKKQIKKRKKHKHAQ